jgi:hypothetical protein
MRIIARPASWSKPLLTMQEISLSFTNVRDEKKLPGIDKVWTYLAERGIDRPTADALGLHIMPAIELIAAARRSPVVNAADGRAAVVFPHYRLGRREDPIEWWSSRLVNISPTPVRLVASFGDFVDPEARAASGPKWGKMFCPPNEPPHGYLPPIYNWAGLKHGDRVYIHESAIKAINGSLLGKASVGLNGVWGWRSKKHDIALIEELKDLPWKALALEPVIVFDSNAWDNWQVQAAESALAAKLMEVTGRHATILRVPKPVEGDQGFDDYRHSVGDSAALAFLDGDGVLADISEMRQMMLQLSNEACVVMELGRIAMQDTGDLMTRAVFTDVNYAHYVTDVEDGERTRQVNVPTLWLRSPDRVVAQKLVYTPGEPKLLRGTTGLPNMNLWRGMGVMPEPGDVTPWLELLNNNVKDDYLRHWITSWCAYPLQHLGKKMNSLLLMFGPSGTGKNLFFKPLHRIYGRNGIIITSDNIRSTFTSIYAQRQFVHADELNKARGDEDTVSQRIKYLVTSDTVNVNRKGQPEYEVDNHINLAITSNYWDCVKLDQDDRRACVIRWDAEEAGGLDRRGDQPYWMNYVHWAEGLGASALYHYLLNYDTTGFDPAAWAPETPWKKEVREASMNSLEFFVHNLYEDPEGTLGLVGGAGKALYTARELASLHYQTAENELTPGKLKAMGDALRNRGFKMANNGKQVRPVGGGNPVIFWVVRRKDEPWGSTEHVKAHLKTLGK